MIYLFLVDNNSEHKKAKDVNRNVVATINHNEYIQFCIRHSMNRIQSKDHKIVTSEINISLPVLMTKYISKTMDMMDYPLGYQSEL